MAERDLVSPLRADLYKTDLADPDSSLGVDLGPIGIWTGEFDALPLPAAAEAVVELEELGCGAVWLPEVSGRDPFAHLMLLLAQARTMTGVTGIATIWARDPVAMKAAATTVASAYPGRFMLGLGVSHKIAVDFFRGFWQPDVERYKKPVATMAAYLDALDAAPCLADQTPRQYPRIVAGLGPKLLALGAERSAGGHTYFVPPEHTAWARKLLGPDALLVVEQAVVVESDPARARELARTHCSLYLSLVNFANNLVRFGFDPEDVVLPGTDKLIDAIVAWGTLDQVIDRVQEHFDAGADHVCIQPVHDGSDGAFLEQCRLLFPAFAEAFGKKGTKQGA